MIRPRTVLLTVLFALLVTGVILGLTLPGPQSAPRPQQTPPASPPAPRPQDFEVPQPPSTDPRIPVTPNNIDDLTPAYSAATAPTRAWTVTARDLGVPATGAHRIGQAADGRTQLMAFTDEHQSLIVGLDSLTGTQRWSFTAPNSLGPGAMGADCRIPTDPERGAILACVNRADGSITYRDPTSGEITHTSPPDPAYANEDVTIHLAREPALLLEIAHSGRIRDPGSGVITITARESATYAVRWRREHRVSGLPSPRTPAQLHGDTLVFPATVVGPQDASYALAVALADGAPRTNWPVTYPLRLIPGVVGTHDFGTGASAFRTHHGDVLPGPPPRRPSVLGVNMPRPFDAQPAYLLECSDDACTAATAVDPGGGRHWTIPLAPSQLVGYCSGQYLFRGTHLQAYGADGIESWQAPALFTEHFTCRAGQVIQQDATGLTALDARTGALIWQIAFDRPDPDYSTDVRQIAAGILTIERSQDPQGAGVTVGLLR